MRRFEIPHSQILPGRWFVLRHDSDANCCWRAWCIPGGLYCLSSLVSDPWLCAVLVLAFQLSESKVLTPPPVASINFLHNSGIIANSTVVDIFRSASKIKSLPVIFFIQRTLTLSSFWPLDNAVFFSKPLLVCHIYDVRKLRLPRIKRSFAFACTSMDIYRLLCGENTKNTQKK